ncbi:MAG TPA: helix-turn-helix transcriptional regulator [Steroidobacteraceae bacterium]|jgi:transcriptional regulator with XRE-family HTH domain|nr:helix-turn-helix transcriptional regulator [Steroidobacteraceae bacterium]
MNLPSSPIGNFLRTRRAQLRPEDFGFAAGQRRRTPGLRREEVAQLCGISPTWLTWIEQGRTRSVSVPTLIAIARGLRLSRAEREYLFGLAAKADPAPPAVAAAGHELLQPLVDAVRAPAYILDRYWDALAWNRDAAQLFPAWLGRSVSATPRTSHPKRNLLHYVFLNPAATRQVVDWNERVPRLVAEFRADTAAQREDPVREALVQELCEASAAFGAAWRSEAVQSREGGLRRLRLKGRQVRSYRQITLRVARERDLKLVVLL